MASERSCFGFTHFISVIARLAGQTKITTAAWGIMSSRHKLSSREHSSAWVFMGRRDKPGDDGLVDSVQSKTTLNTGLLPEHGTQFVVLDQAGEAADRVEAEAARVAGFGVGLDLA